MNEIDKMRNSQLADMEKPEIQASFIPVSYTHLTLPTNREV